MTDSVTQYSQATTWHFSEKKIIFLKKISKETIQNSKQS